jgi:hypothetical protein
MNPVPIPAIALIGLWMTLIAWSFSVLRGKNRRGQSVVSGMLLACVALTVALGAASCGGGGTVVQTSPPVGGTPAGTYSILITGTSSNAAEPMQTLQLVVTVQ